VPKLDSAPSSWSKEQEQCPARALPGDVPLPVIRKYFQEKELRNETHKTT
jgi:hypothetical protein